MKLYKFLFIIFIISMIPLNYSCEDVLDKNDLTGMASDLVWEDEAYIDAYVSTLYFHLRGWVDSYTGGFRVMDDIADEGRSGYASFLPNSIMLPGLLTAEMDDQIHDMHYWQMYKEIRACNEFFSNMEHSSLDSKEIKTLTAEVRFIRAFHYFELVKRYGGVPLILKPQKLDDPEIFPARNTADECFSFIVDEFNQAAKTFEGFDIVNTNTARAGQGAALAFKAKALLYYASPQFNSGNDPQRWQDAANAAKAVIDLGVFNLDPDFSQICRRANDELIFKKEYKLHSNPSPWIKYDHGRSTGYLPLSHARGDAGYSYPVQEFVDAFRMKNGLEISDGASGYDPKRPYQGRDPRFYSSVTYNGAVFMGDTVWTYVGSPPGTWGDGISANPFTTNTGYFCRKMIKEDLPDNYWGFRDDDTPYPFMRYADILLMYAEAENEASGPDANVVNSIQQIWDRAGLTGNVPSGLSKDDMRTLIHNERYVELSFEEHRYWDLRRWDEAKTRLTGSKFHGMRITLDTLSTAPLVLDTIYTKVEIDIFVPEFKPYMNFLPIPYSEMLANPNLVQNPGW